MRNRKTVEQECLFPKTFRPCHGEHIGPPGWSTEQIYSFADGLQPDEADFTIPGADDQISQFEEATALLDEVFGDDTQARDVFVLRAEADQSAEVQRRLQITPKEYETVNRRILRRIAVYTKSTKSKGANYAQ